MKSCNWVYFGVKCLGYLDFFCEESWSLFGFLSLCIIMVWEKGCEGGLICCFGYGIYGDDEFMSLSIGMNVMVDGDLKVLYFIVLNFYGIKDGFVSLEDGFMFVEVL